MEFLGGPQESNSNHFLQDLNKISQLRIVIILYLRKVYRLVLDFFFFIPNQITKPVTGKLAQIKLAKK